jgi:hypothetical protein
MEWLVHLIFFFLNLGQGQSSYLLHESPHVCAAPTLCHLAVVNACENLGQYLIHRFRSLGLAEGIGRFLAGPERFMIMSNDCCDYSGGIF